jgi:hypothetical protein
MNQNGSSLPRMNCHLRIGVTLSCSMVPISFSRTMFMLLRNMPTNVTSTASRPGTIRFL